MKEAYVGIYCKVGADQFPDPPWYDKNLQCLAQTVTSQMIYDFLMADTGYAWDNEKDVPLGGDKNIWTLCTNEKFGSLEIWDSPQDTEPVFCVCWGMDQYHVRMVQSFIDELYNRDILSSDHYSKLIAECQFADQHFSIHYDIWKYLISKR